MTPGFRPRAAYSRGRRRNRPAAPRRPPLPQWSERAAQAAARARFDQTACNEFLLGAAARPMASAFGRASSRSAGMLAYEAARARETERVMRGCTQVCYFACRDGYALLLAAAVALSAK